MSELVDLSKLDAPKVLEDLDFETLLAERKQEFTNLFDESERPFWQSRLSLESEPITKTLARSSCICNYLNAHALIKLHSNNACLCHR